MGTRRAGDSPANQLRALRRGPADPGEASRLAAARTGAGAGPPGGSGSYRMRAEDDDRPSASALALGALRQPTTLSHRRQAAHSGRSHGTPAPTIERAVARPRGYGRLTAQWRAGRRRPGKLPCEISLIISNLG